MKDHLALVTVALVTSMLAWAFWHYLGDDAFNVLILIFLIVLIGDNYQLRKKLGNKNSNKTN